MGQFRSVTIFELLLCAAQIIIFFLNGSNANRQAYSYTQCRNNYSVIVNDKYGAYIKNCFEGKLPQLQNCSRLAYLENDFWWKCFDLEVYNVNHSPFRYVNNLDARYDICTSPGTYPVVFEFHIYLCHNKAGYPGACFEGFYFDQTSRMCKPISAFNYYHQHNGNGPHNPWINFADRYSDNINCLDELANVFKNSTNFYNVCYYGYTYPLRCLDGFIFNETKYLCETTKMVVQPLISFPIPQYNNLPVHYDSVSGLIIRHINSNTYLVICPVGKEWVYELAICLSRKDEFYIASEWSKRQWLLELKFWPQYDNSKYCQFVKSNQSSTMHYQCHYEHTEIVTFFERIDWSAGQYRCDDSCSSGLRVAPPVLRSIKTSLCPKYEHPLYPTYLQHKTDCHTFYKCLYGKAYPFSCPLRKYWNNELKQCVSTTDHCMTEDSIEDDVEEEEPEYNELCPPYEDPDTPTYLPHPKDSTKFYHCFYGTAYPNQCDKGEQWNNFRKTCSLAAEKPMQIIPVIAEDSEIEEIYLPFTSEQCTEYGFFPDSLDCRKFYQCHFGYAYPVTCPDGLHWNQNHLRCEYPDEAGCTQYVGICYANLPILPYRLCPAYIDPETPTYLPHPEDCSQFQMCLYGYSYIISCPEGLHFSERYGRCEHPIEANCISSQYVIKDHAVPDYLCPAIENPGYPKVSKHENPMKFYQCYFGYNYTLSCSFGQHWNQIERLCMPNNYYTTETQYSEDEKRVETSVQPEPMLDIPRRSKPTATCFIQYDDYQRPCTISNDISWE